MILLGRRDVNKESGWKLVQGDVFRPPRSLMILSTLVVLESRCGSRCFERRIKHIDCLDP
jgi:hypothetical protein